MVSRKEKCPRKPNMLKGGQLASATLGRTHNKGNMSVVTINKYPKRDRHFSGPAWLRSARAAWVEKEWEPQRNEEVHGEDDEPQHPSKLPRHQTHEREGE